MLDLEPVLLERMLGRRMHFLRIKRNHLSCSRFLLLWLLPLWFVRLRAKRRFMLVRQPMLLRHLHCRLVHRSHKRAGLQRKQPVRD